MPNHLKIIYPELITEFYENKLKDDPAGLLQHLIKAYCAVCEKPSSGLFSETPLLSLAKSLTQRPESKNENTASFDSKTFAALISEHFKTLMDPQDSSLLILLKHFLAAEPQAAKDLSEEQSKALKIKPYALMLSNDQIERQIPRPEALQGLSYKILHQLPYLTLNDRVIGVMLRPDKQDGVAGLILNDHQDEKQCQETIQDTFSRHLTRREAMSLGGSAERAQHFFLGISPTVLPALNQLHYLKDKTEQQRILAAYLEHYESFDFNTFEKQLPFLYGLSPLLSDKQLEKLFNLTLDHLVHNPANRSLNSFLLDHYDLLDEKTLERYKKLGNENAGELIIDELAFHPKLSLLLDKDRIKSEFTNLFNQLNKVFLAVYDKLIYLNINFDKNNQLMDAEDLTLLASATVTLLQNNSLATIAGKRFSALAKLTPLFSEDSKKALGTEILKHIMEGPTYFEPLLNLLEPCLDAFEEKEQTLCFPLIVPMAPNWPIHIEYSDYQRFISSFVERLNQKMIDAWANELLEKFHEKKAAEISPQSFELMGRLALKASAEARQNLINFLAKTESSPEAFKALALIKDLDHQSPGEDKLEVAIKIRLEAKLDDFENNAERLKSKDLQALALFAPFLSEEIKDLINDRVRVCINTNEDKPVNFALRLLQDCSKLITNKSDAQLHSSIVRAINFFEKKYRSIETDWPQTLASYTSVNNDKQLKQTFELIIPHLAPGNSANQAFKMLMSKLPEESYNPIFYGVLDRWLITGKFSFTPVIEANFMITLMEVAEEHRTKFELGKQLKAGPKELADLIWDYHKPT